VVCYLQWLLVSSERFYFLIGCWHAQKEMSVKYRQLYPENWEELAKECKDRAGWRCQFCGVAHGDIAISRRGEPYTIYLAAAHLDHDPWNPRPRLAALCPSCHGRYDWQDLERKRWLELEILRHQLWVQAYVYSEAEWSVQLERQGGA